MPRPSIPLHSTNSTNHEAHHYVLFSILLSLHPSQVQYHLNLEHPQTARRSGVQTHLTAFNDAFPTDYCQAKCCYPQLDKYSCRISPCGMLLDQLYAPFIFNLFSHYTSTCFALASCPSSGGDNVNGDSQCVMCFRSSNYWTQICVQCCLAFPVFWIMETISLLREQSYTHQHTVWTENGVQVWDFYSRWYQRRTEGGVWGGSNQPLPPKFQSFDKAEPNSRFRGIYIRNNVIGIVRSRTKSTEFKV
jgi:hypothetical protein